MAEENIETKIEFSKKLENFWYHYKWHTIVAAFLIVVIVFSMVQIFNKPKYDLYIMYAGGDDIKMTRGGEEESEYEKLLSAVKRHVNDGNGDGERTLTLQNLFLPSDEEIAEIESKNDGTEVNYTLILENDEVFRQNIVYGNYYIALISKELHDEWTKEDRSNPFAKITDYLPKDAEYTLGSQINSAEGYVLPSEYGVYLSSTPLYDNPGFSDLAPDTVLVLRRHIKATKKVSGISSEEYYKNCEDIFRRMLADKAYS